MKRLQSRVWLVVVVVIVLFFIGIFTNPRLSRTAVTLEQLMTDMEVGRVREVVVQGDTEISATYVDGTLAWSSKPAEMNLLEEVNLAGDLGTALVYREETPSPLGIILRAAAFIILPLIALTALYIIFIARINAARSAS